ncbi:MAG: DUF222 domain-containing protein, partial [Actinomycetes bacterium]
MTSSLLPPGEHPALSALRTVGHGLDELAEAPVWSLSDADLLEVRGQLQRLLSRLTSAAFGATHEIDVRGAAVSAGAASLVAWLVSVPRLHPAEAGREVQLSAALSRDLPATATALADGVITSAAVTVIAETDRALAVTATAAERSQAEQLLAEHAQQLNIRGLQAAALHLRHRLDPEHGKGMAADEARLTAQRELRLLEQPDGSCRLSGQLDKEASAFLRT